MVLASEVLAVRHGRIRGGGERKRDGDSRLEGSRAPATRRAWCGGGSKEEEEDTDGGGTWEGADGGTAARG